MRKVELLIKPVSYTCNLDCGYCFYKKTSGLYPGKELRMREEILEKLIYETMVYSGGGPCVFSWQGGEPLLAGVNFFKKAVELQKKYGRPGQMVSNNLQTNTIELDSEWIKLFKEYNFFIGASLDGPPEVHNHYRRYRSGRGSFNRVMEGIRLLKKGGVEFNILTTLGRETAGNPKKIYKFFLSKELYYLQFIPAADRKVRSGKMANFSITPVQYGDFLCRLFDLWWNDGNPYVSVRLFDNIMEILLLGESSSCMFKEQCGEYIVVESNGDVYPCDFFVRKEWRIGNISENSINELFDKARATFGKLKGITPSDCKDCKWNFICHNGCLWFRWVNGGNMKEKDYLCEAYKKFFSYTMERFKKLQDVVASRSVARIA
ncbi:MAG TPA: anaerobic sulfatase maturase [Candidatus Omnitrophica bacterium]|nr:anaerobic sulfatase maturase [Candidatus Omnitrophota bacterium]